MSLKTLESSAFFGGKLLISVWKYGIKKLPVGKNVEEEEQELDLLLHQPQAIYSAQNISGTLLLKLPSLRATVPSSTSATGIPFHPFACAEGILFCKLVCPKFNQWFLNVSVGAGYSPACANASGKGQCRHVLSVLHQHQIRRKGPWTPICSGSVVHFGNNWFTQLPSPTVGSKDKSWS